ncbi:MAG: hypothetical protein WBX22_32195 [Silvibacterium sp.]
MKPGTGVAIIDYDRDGWPDIFLGNGQEMDPIEVRWPNGETEAFTVPSVDRYLDLVEGHSTLR